MAIFHFRIKSDKKPDGTKVSAFKHVDYIRREGNFTEVENWEQKNKFVGNFIFATGKIFSFTKLMISVLSEILRTELK